MDNNYKVIYNFWELEITADYLPHPKGTVFTWQSDGIGCGIHHTFSNLFRHDNKWHLRFKGRKENITEGFSVRKYSQIREIVYSSENKEWNQ
jgi:hypothetical protein